MTDEVTKFMESVTNAINGPAYCVKKDTWAEYFLLKDVTDVDKTLFLMSHIVENGNTDNSIIFTNSHNKNDQYLLIKMDSFRKTYNPRSYSATWIAYHNHSSFTERKQYTRTKEGAIKWCVKHWMDNNE